MKSDEGDGRQCWPAFLAPGHGEGIALAAFCWGEWLALAASTKRRSGAPTGKNASAPRSRSTQSDEFAKYKRALDLNRVLGLLDNANGGARVTLGPGEFFWSLDMHRQAEVTEVNGGRDGAFPLVTFGR